MVRFAGELVQALSVAHGTGDPATENLDALGRLVSTSGATEHEIRGRPSHWLLWHGVKASRVRAFLASFHAYATASFLDRCQSLIAYIDERNAAEELLKWTVCVLCKKNGKSGEQTLSLGRFEIWPVSRSGIVEDDRYEMKAVVGSAEESVDLSAEEYADALKKTQRMCEQNDLPLKDVPDRQDVRAARPTKRGLLLVYPIRADTGEIVVSAGLSFPVSPNAPALAYTVNEVWAEQYGLELEPSE